MDRSYNLRIITEPMPDGIRGMSTLPKGTDRLTIIINSEQPEEIQAATFLHEWLHVWHDDHNSNSDVNMVETERRGEIIELLEILRMGNNEQED